MLNWDKVNKEAICKAEKVLEKGFNAEAFICLSLAKKNAYIDEAPETEIDEEIVTMKDEFVEYMQAKRLYQGKKIKSCDMIVYLEKTMKQLHKIVNEILHTCETSEEREKCLEYLKKISELK